MDGKHRILVALSGGVDSSVAAALLAKQGHRLLGVTLKLAPDGSQGQCCGLDGVARARQVCDRLGIPFTVVDAVDFFRQTVIDPFVDDYAAARTPNPCVSCNRHVKFAYLFDVARQYGFDHIATGHYARIANGELRRGVDKAKDQSYALYMLTHHQLSRLHFPLGDYEKHDTRKMAADLGLATAHTPESQDICFVGPDHVSFLEKLRPGIGTEGDIVTTTGRVLGRHGGLHRHTVGQRKGLGVAGGDLDGPWYVLRLDRDRNHLVVGTADEVGQDELLITGISTTLPGNDPTDLHGEARIQVRYGKQTAPATIHPGPAPGTLLVHPHTPVVSAPGQAAVVYAHDDDRVLGGGTLTRARRLSPTQA